METLREKIVEKEWNELLPLLHQEDAKGQYIRAHLDGLLSEWAAKPSRPQLERLPSWWTVWVEAERAIQEYVDTVGKLWAASTEELRMIPANPEYPELGLEPIKDSNYTEQVTRVRDWQTSLELEIIASPHQVIVKDCGYFENTQYRYLLSDIDTVIEKALDEIDKDDAQYVEARKKAEAWIDLLERILDHRTARVQDYPVQILAFNETHTIGLVDGVAAQWKGAFVFPSRPDEDDEDCDVIYVEEETFTDRHDANWRALEGYWYHDDEWDFWGGDAVPRSMRTS